MRDINRLPHEVIELIDTPPPEVAMDYNHPADHRLVNMAKDQVRNPFVRME